MVFKLLHKNFLILSWSVRGRIFQRSRFPYGMNPMWRELHFDLKLYSERGESIFLENFLPRLIIKKPWGSDRHHAESDSDIPIGELRVLENETINIWEEKGEQHEEKISIPIDYDNAFYSRLWWRTGDYLWRL